VAELADLRWHWGGASRITARYGMFRAERRDDGAAVSCATAAGLRVLIRDDYARGPSRVPDADPGTQIQTDPLPNVQSAPVASL
jgi:hypothetical protein